MKNKLREIFEKLLIKACCWLICRERWRCCVHLIWGSRMLVADNNRYIKNLFLPECLCFLSLSATVFYRFLLCAFILYNRTHQPSAVRKNVPFPSGHWEWHLLETSICKPDNSLLNLFTKYICCTLYLSSIWLASFLKSFSITWFFLSVTSKWVRNILSAREDYYWKLREKEW